jgi:hypothetical protein
MARQGMFTLCSRALALKRKTWTVSDLGYTVQLNKVEYALSVLLIANLRQIRKATGRSAWTVSLVSPDKNIQQIKASEEV